jgi:hypothetical protein
MFDIVSLNNKKKWDEIVRSMYHYDFYHLAGYNQLDDSGSPCLLYFRNNTTAFAFPIILRPIKIIPNYYDITSVYGYAGPLANTENPDSDSIAAFQQVLIRFFDVYSIVSVFSRLHPLFRGQENLLSGLGDIVDTNLTVCIDLKLPETEQKKQYSHSLKNAVNRLRRKNLTVFQAQTPADIDAFVEVYEENMKRVNATKQYFFPKEYFHQFIRTINATLLLASYDDKIICGSLFTECNGIVQPHLSATKNEYLHLSPLKYVWDCIRITAKEKNMNYLHLGGGFGGKNDSLFGFKSQFSKQYCMFKTWRYIHNQEIYNQLVSKTYENDPSESSYFPLYRSGK